MPKWFKTILALLLLPACVGAVQALGWVLRASGHATTVWVAAASGAAAWLVIYLMLPKPTWVYVFGHELTHVLWTWLFGGGVRKFKVTAKGGHVVVTKNNFLISLAPYFFPLYAILVVMVYLVGQFFWNWSPYVAVFHVLLGAAYAFHVTLTSSILQTQQSDITQHGYLFSAVVIFLGNFALLLIGIPLLTGGVTVPSALLCWWQCTRELLLAFRRLF